MTGNFIKNLEARLSKELPGRKSQYKMAPARTIVENSSNKPGMASILILLFPHQKNLGTLLIKRSEYPGHHSGQISFPGGKNEKTDESPVHTALREAHEEAGIDPCQVRVLGTLTPLHIPVSNIEVLPVIGYTDARPEFIRCKNEVDYLIYVPLRELLKECLRTEKQITINSEPVYAPGYIIKNEFVWGATAMILSEFLEIAASAYQCNL